MSTNWKQPPPSVGSARDVFKAGALYTTKDLANVMLLHVRTVKRWWKKLNVPPFVSRNGCHRWTYRQAITLLNRWRKYQATHRIAACWRNGKKHPC